jgi:hypothetical protein
MTGMDGKVNVEGILIRRKESSLMGSNHIHSICSGTKQLWDDDSFLEKYDIPSAACCLVHIGGRENGL